MSTTVEDKKVPYSRTNPFPASVIKNVNLNGPGTIKETRHLELSLEVSDLSYNPGDALGIVPENDPELVTSLLKEMKWDPEMEVVLNKQGETLTLKRALTSYFEITLLSKKMMQGAVEFTESKDLQMLLLTENADQLKEYVYGRDLLDMLLDFGPWKASAQNIVSLLRKLTPRLYSIASSFTANPGQVHLTIGAVRYTSHGRERKGVCSVQVAERLHEGDTIPVFVQPNKHFHLPESLDKDIIMAGPGTGIAPFRSFIQERAVTNATGRTWLFFGDQHEACDFLYKSEFTKYFHDRVLTSLTTAWSRDTAQKVYVQHKILENSEKLFDWFQSGAYFYICGDKQNMARDVHNALIAAIAAAGEMPPEAAEAYLSKMQAEGRYQRDVY